MIIIIHIFHATSIIAIIHSISLYLFPFFFNDTATTEIYTLSLHDALPICTAPAGTGRVDVETSSGPIQCATCVDRFAFMARSEEHTSELQSHVNLVCRLLLEKKKKKKI